MTSLAIRRLIVLAVSIVLGILMSLLFQYIILPAVSPNPNEAPIAIARYGAQYFFWTAFPFTMIFVTLLDGFMDTRIWPD